MSPPLPADSSQSGEPTLSRSQPKFAILKPPGPLPPWKARCIGTTTTQGDARLMLVIETGGPESGMSPAGAAPPKPSLRPDKSVIVAPVIRFRESKTAALCEAVRKAGIDFILHFGGPVPEDLARAARHGLWCFDHDEAVGRSGATAAMQPILDGMPTTPVRLIGIQDGVPSILAEAILSTDGLSLDRNRERMNAAAVYLPAQHIRMLRHSGVGEKIARSAAAPLPAPGTRERTHLTFLTAWARLCRNVRPLFRHAEWNIGIREGSVADFLSPPGVDAASIDWIRPHGANGFHADPFLTSLPDGSEILLFEDFDYRRWKGTLAAIRIDGNGDAIREPLFESGGHLAYPFCFRHEGTTYCVPESCEDGEIALYRLLDKPLRLEKAAVLLGDVEAVDSTVFRYRGMWWVFYTDRTGDPNGYLNIAYAKDLFGPWTRHSGNPVKIDVGSARPGGTPFVHQSELYRPAQDCSRTYGGRLVLNRITVLTPEHFAEEPAAVIEPLANSRWCDGIHTLSLHGNRMVIDSKREGFRPMTAYGVLARQARRLVSRLSRAAGRQQRGNAAVRPATQAE